MELLFIAFVFSFVGSIPPGTINLSVMQLSLKGRKSAAFRFALAAALVEYPYAYIALKFEGFLSDASLIQKNFEILGVVVMITLGLLSLWNNWKPGARPIGFMDSGFRRGVIISLLNPLAIPFWIGVTAYLRFQGWINLQSELDLHYYVAGVSIGTFSLLAVVAIFSSRFGEKFSRSRIVRFLPSMAFLGLGLYGLVKLISG